MVRANADADPFDNDMGKTTAKQYGFGEGKRVVWGVLSKEVDPSELNDQSAEALARRAALKEAAAADLVNIDPDERSKRKTIATGAGVVALLVATGLTVGDVTNPLIRGAAMYVPLAIMYGFYGSGQQGLCGIGQAGAWDVDGTGVDKIEDTNVALAIQAKINTLWRNVAVLAVTTDVTFALLPTIFK